MHTLISQDQWTTTFATSLSSRATERVIGNLNVDPRQGVRDPRAIGKPEVERPRGEYVTPSVRLPCRTIRRSLGQRRMTSTTSAPFSSHYETTGNMELFPPCTRSTTRRSAACRTIRTTGGMRSGLSASACFLGKIPSNRSEVNAITLFLQVLELIKNLHLGTITKFLDFAPLNASTVWETCGSTSRTSMYLIPSEMTQHSLCRCYVITFENSSFDLMKVTCEV